jgi:hypothetical protein
MQVIVVVVVLVFLCGKQSRADKQGDQLRVTQECR